MTFDLINDTVATYKDILLGRVEIDLRSNFSQFTWDASDLDRFPTVHLDTQHLT